MPSALTCISPGHSGTSSELPTSLPSFGPYFQNPLDLAEEDEQHSLTWIRLTGWAQSIIFDPSFPRFVREHPDEARSFYHVLTERAANLPTWTYNNNTFFPVQFFPRFIPFLCEFARILAAHLPAPGLPHLSLATRNGITDMAMANDLSDQMLSLQSTLDPTIFDILAESIFVCYALGSDSGKEVMAGLREELIANPEGTVWWGCEFLKGQAGMGRRECVKLGEGRK